MLSVASPQALCQLCGGNLDTSLLEGSCPACLWGGLIAGGFGDEVAEDLPEIEGYQIRHQIGRGGMGVVYLATQESPARDVALKIVAPYTFRGASQRLRFLVEIEAMAAVAHPALLPLYESGEDDEGRPWFSMRLASGGNLAEKLLQYQGQWQLAATLMVRLAEAVQYSHERGILHRDLKPANVLFDEEGNAYVADFGLAKWAENDVGLTQSTEMLGSPVYLAPEAVLGGTKATTTASDIYGLGTIFYELLTGHQLYEGASAAGVMTQILQNAPVPPRQKVATIPRDLEIITLKAISRDPGKRYVSAAALAEDLQLWLAGKAIKARPVGPFEQLWNWTRRNPAMAALACLLLVSIVTGGVLQWRSNQRLTISLADAEDRVEFMTRELPVSLAPLGRLDLLDGIFENLNQHYQVTTRTDADSLARQADFLTQWAQILRPRGDNIAAIERLHLAMAKAKAAVSGHHPPPAAILSRISTGWRLGEALIEGKNHDEAEAVLNETMVYAAKHPSEDLRRQILNAQLTLEFAYLEYSRWNLQKVQIHAQNALRKWQPLLPTLEHQPISARNQITLAEVLKNHLLLETAARRLKDEADVKVHLTEYEAMAQRLVSLAPANTNFRSLLLLAHLRMAETVGLETHDVLARLTSAEEQASTLIVIDGGNTRWLLDAVKCADALALHARKNGDTVAFHRWRDVMAKRLDRQYLTLSTDLGFLMQQFRSANNCGTYFMEDDWPTARHHFEAAMQTRKRGAKLTGSDQGIKGNETALFELIKKHEGLPAAQKWRDAFIQSP